MRIYRVAEGRHNSLPCQYRVILFRTNKLNHMQRLNFLRLAMKLIKAHETVVEQSVVSRPSVKFMLEKLNDRRKTRR